MWAMTWKLGQGWVQALSECPTVLPAWVRMATTFPPGDTSRHAPDPNPSHAHGQAPWGLEVRDQSSLSLPTPSNATGFDPG